MASQTAERTSQLDQAVAWTLEELPQDELERLMAAGSLAIKQSVLCDAGLADTEHPAAGVALLNRWQFDPQRSEIEAMLTDATTTGLRIGIGTDQALVERLIEELAWAGYGVEVFDVRDPRGAVIEQRYRLDVAAHDPLRGMAIAAAGTWQTRPRQSWELRQPAHGLQVALITAELRDMAAGLQPKGPASISPVGLSAPYEAETVDELRAELAGMLATNVGPELERRAAEKQEVDATLAFSRSIMNSYGTTPDRQEACARLCGPGGIFLPPTPSQAALLKELAGMGYALEADAISVRLLEQPPDAGAATIMRALGDWQITAENYEVYRAISDSPELAERMAAVRDAQAAWCEELRTQSRSLAVAGAVVRERDRPARELLDAAAELSMDEIEELPIVARARHDFGEAMEGARRGHSLRQELAGRWPRKETVAAETVAAETVAAGTVAVEPEAAGTVAVEPEAVEPEAVEPEAETVAVGTEAETIAVGTEAETIAAGTVAVGTEAETIAVGTEAAETVAAETEAEAVGPEPAEAVVPQIAARFRDFALGDGQLAVACCSSPAAAYHLSESVTEQLVEDGLLGDTFLVGGKTLAPAMPVLYQASEDGEQRLCFVVEARTNGTVVIRDRDSGNMVLDEVAAAEKLRPAWAVADPEHVPSWAEVITVAPDAHPELTPPPPELWPMAPPGGRLDPKIARRNLAARTARFEEYMEIARSETDDDVELALGTLDRQLDRASRAAGTVDEWPPATVAELERARQLIEHGSGPSHLALVEKLAAETRAVRTFVEQRLARFHEDAAEKVEEEVRMQLRDGKAAYAPTLVQERGEPDELFREREREAMVAVEAFRDRWQVNDPKSGLGNLAAPGTPKAVAQEQLASAHGLPLEAITRPRPQITPDTVAPAIGWKVPPRQRLPFQAPPEVAELRIAR